MSIIRKPSRTALMACTGAVLVTLASGWSQAEAAGSPFTVGTDFTGSVFGELSDTELLDESGNPIQTANLSIPPDTMGAVGPDHIVEMINRRVVIYDKTGSEIGTPVTLRKFFIDGGAGAGTFDSPFDPRIIYDPTNERWFAAATDGDNFLVSVSATSDPTGSWSAFAVDGDSDDSHSMDFPTMGLNQDVLTISSNMIGASDVVTLLIIPMTDLLAVSPTVANNTLMENVDPNDTGYSIQPLVDMDVGSGQPHPMLSSYNKSAGLLRRTDITGSPTAPGLSSSVDIAVTARPPPPDAVQPGGAVDIETNDHRFSTNVVDGSMWAAHAVEVEGRSAVEWYQIRESDNAMLQSGLFADTDMDFYFPSIAVNDGGDVVVGFSGSSLSQFVSSYAAIGITSAGSTSFTAPQLLYAGVSTYEQVSGGRNRWGDYSATVVDPSKSRTFWTFQEFVPSTDTWGIRVTEITLIPLPAAAWMGLVLLAVLAVAGRIRAGRPAA